MIVATVIKSTVMKLHVHCSILVGVGVTTLSSCHWTRFHENLEAFGLDDPMAAPI